MTTATQCFRFAGRPLKQKKCSTPDLASCPQKRGTIKRVMIHSPKKPNSARRKVMRVILSNRKTVFCYIPGIGHSAQIYHSLFVRGGRRQDLPGMKYTAIRSRRSLMPPVGRRTARSKYGLTKSFL
jgi:small subunit ribosomal protein S12